MTLQVSFDRFPETVKRLLNQQEAYICAHSGGTLVTSAKSDKDTVVASLSPLTIDLTATNLKTAGFSIFDGSWLAPETIQDQHSPAAVVFIAAVSYRSSDDKPGVWVDAYPSLPTQITVLKTMYEEFRQTGEVHDVAFEEFVQLANPNVVIVSPAEVESFLKQKVDC